MTAHDDLFKRSLRLFCYHRRTVWWITSRVFLLTVALTALGLALNPKYVARATFTLLPTRSELGFAAVRPEMLGLSPATLLGQTHQEAMLSRTLAEEVARALQAEKTADLNNRGVAGFVRRWLVAPALGSFHRTVTLLNTGRWKTPDPLLALVDGIRSRTKVQNLPGSFVFQVSVTWENPALAAKIANLMTERYVQMTLRSNQAEMRTTREYLEARIREVEESLAQLQQKIKDYRAAEKVYSMAYNTSADVDLGLQELSQSLRALAAVRADRQQLEARLDALKAYQTPVALAALEAERNGLKARQTAVEQAIDEQMAKLNALPAKEAGLLDLYRERTIKERALTGLQDRLLETKVAEAAQLSAVRVIDPAIAPLYPERPLLLRNAAASIPVGLLLALGFVLLTEARRAGLRCREDLGGAGEALLGLVPCVAAPGHDDPDAEKSGKKEEFFRNIAHGRYGTVAHRRVVKRHLEHLLLRLTEGGERRICMFVSLHGGEGKTFLIEQLARLAREAGGNVLLVDANLNQPALHRLFGKPLSAGLAETLLGAARAGEALVSIEDGLDLLCAGATRLSGQTRWDLLACKEELRRLAEAYDLVLMDSAALRQDPAVARLSRLSDRAVCVFDATASAQGDLDAVREHLRGSPIPVDVVLNKVLYKADYLFGTGLPADSARQPRPAPARRKGDAGAEGTPSAAAAGETRRKYVRRASQLPVVCRTNGTVNGCEQELRNLSYGGFSFAADRQHAPGEMLKIEFPFLEHVGTLRGAVVWTRQVADAPTAQYLHGVRFVDAPETVLIPLLDSVRRIEEYRERQRRRTGRELSAREAAAEWKQAGGDAASR